VSAEQSSDPAQTVNGQSLESVSEALEGFTGAAAFGVTDNVEGSGGLETLGLGIALAPGDTEQDEEQRLERPARFPALLGAKSAGQHAIDLPEQGWAEKMPQAGNEPRLAESGLAVAGFL